VRRKLKLSEATQKRLLYAFESIFLIRRIPILGKRSDTFLLEDQLEEWVLSQEKLTTVSRVYGALYRNLRAQFGYRSGILFECFSFRLRSGAWVPLVFKSGGREVGFIVMEGHEPTLGQKRSADRFLCLIDGILVMPPPVLFVVLSGAGRSAGLSCRNSASNSPGDLYPTLE